MSQHCARNCASSALRSRNVTNTGRIRDAVAMTSGRFSVHDRHGGHEPLALPRGERPGPAAGIDACLAHQLGGCYPAYARKRPQERIRAHPPSHLVGPCQGLLQGFLACLQACPEPLPLGSQLQALEAGSLALLKRERRRYRLRTLRSIRSRGTASPGSRPCCLCAASYGRSSCLGGRTSVTNPPRVLPRACRQLGSESLRHGRVRLARGTWHRTLIGCSLPGDCPGRQHLGRTQTTPGVAPEEV